MTQTNMPAEIYFYHIKLIGTSFSESFSGYYFQTKLLLPQHTTLVSFFIFYCYMSWLRDTSVWAPVCAQINNNTVLSRVTLDIEPK